MTVKELIERLQRHDGNLEVVVGHPLHDYCGQIEATTPLIEEGHKHKPGSWANRWLLRDRDGGAYEDADDIWVPILVIA